MTSVIENTCVQIEMTRTDLLAIRGRLTQIDYILLSHGDMTVELTEARKKLKDIELALQTTFTRIDDIWYGLIKIQAAVNLIQPISNAQFVNTDSGGSDNV